MSVTTARSRTREGHRWPPAVVVTLAVLLVLLSVGALQGGIAMVINPVDPLGMSPSFLNDAPVGDYFWPGMFLLGIAAASLITVFGLLFGWRWPWASRIETVIGYRWPSLAAVSIGSVLLAFELVELVIIPFHPIMHPLLIAGSLAILLLPFARSARAHLRAR